MAQLQVIGRPKSTVVRGQLSQTQGTSRDAAFHIRLLELREFDVRPQLDLVEDGLEFGVGKDFVPAADGDGEAVERGARNSARQQSIADHIEKIEKMLAVRYALGGPAQRVVHRLQCENTFERGDGAGAAHDLRAGLAPIGNLEGRIGCTRVRRATNEAGIVDTAIAFDLHGRVSQCDTPASPGVVKKWLRRERHSGPVSARRRAGERGLRLARDHFRRQPRLEHQADGPRHEREKACNSYDGRTANDRIENR
jgi:hypothetical protein